MDWAQDNARLSDLNLNRVFKYAPRESTVVQIPSGNPVRHPMILQGKFDH